VYLDAYKDYPWRLQRYTQEDQNSDRIRVLQKIIHPIMKAQVKMNSKVFWNPSQSFMRFKNFGGGSIGYLKITEDKALDAGVTKREGHSQLRRQSQVRRKYEISTQMWISS